MKNNKDKLIIAKDNKETLLKDKLIHLLSSIFGDEVKKIVDENYTSNKELIELSFHMLSGYMGKENAKKLLLKKQLITKEDLSLLKGIID